MLEGSGRGWTRGRSSSGGCGWVGWGSGGAQLKIPTAHRFPGRTGAELGLQICAGEPGGLGKLKGCSDPQVWRTLCPNLGRRLWPAKLHSFWWGGTCWVYSQGPQSPARQRKIQPQGCGYGTKSAITSPQKTLTCRTKFLSGHLCAGVILGSASGCRWLRLAETILHLLLVYQGGACGCSPPRQHQSSLGGSPASWWVG